LKKVDSFSVDVPADEGKGDFDFLVEDLNFEHLHFGNYLDEEKRLPLLVAVSNKDAYFISLFVSAQKLYVCTKIQSIAAKGTDVSDLRYKGNLSFSILAKNGQIYFVEPRRLAASQK
jgi:hypothetical protein